MKIVQSIWSLASENGGPTRSTIGLSKALGCAGVEVVLVSHVPGKVSQASKDDLQSCSVEFREGRGNGFFVALRDAAELLDECKPDIVHIQGLWKMSTHAMSVVAAQRDIPVIISPRGMLDPWALSVKKWKKRIGMFLYQKRDLRRAAAFHATSSSEAAHIYDFGLHQRVVTIPNGVDIPNVSHSGACRGTERKALFLSRLHPGKGLLYLAEAWASVRPRGWRMVVVGPDENGHRSEVEHRLKNLKIENEWTFVGEVSDIDKWEYYCSADLFIHPSASENFGISIAEALSCGLPVITTKGCPWQVIEGRCGWWIDRNVDALAATLREAMSLTDDVRFAMGVQGKELIKENYSWATIASRMIDFYNEIITHNDDDV